MDIETHGKGETWFCSTCKSSWRELRSLCRRGQRLVALHPLREDKKTLCWVESGETWIDLWKVFQIMITLKSWNKFSIKEPMSLQG